MTTLILIIFVAGYIAIAFEHIIHVNKAASALLTGVLCWAVYALSGEKPAIVSKGLSDQFGEISGILFFLLGAMVIVELIDTHDGFQIIIERIQKRSKKKLAWVIGVISFLLSAVLNNLATAIVMIALLRKVIPAPKERLLFAGLVIIAVNAGGAWSPIGDVTTTMLWMGKQVTAWNIIISTIIPSLVSFLLPAWLISFQLKGNIEKENIPKEKLNSTRFERNIVFGLGVFSLLMVPLVQSLTNLPPYMGVSFGLGLMWVVTELMHDGKNEQQKGIYSVNNALRKIDMPSILFFLGILLSVAALHSAGMLHTLSMSLNNSIGNSQVVALATGFLSAVVDNVPLVAAAQGMYGLEQFPTDHSFWELIAYCSGTGGSMLIIGSAAGVAAMGMEKIKFFWYLKNITWLAMIGYIAGAVTFFLQHYITG